MRLIGYFIAVVLIAWWLINYSGRDEAVDNAIPDAYEQSLDRAEHVEQMLQDGAELRQREIEQSEN